MKTAELIFKMLTENTGSHFLDSGGAYGRNWQHNAEKTLADFESEPQARLEIDGYEREGKVSYSFSPTISLFHHLTSCLEQDGLCKEFNALEVGNWNGQFYGTDQNQCDWLDDHGFDGKEDGFNSYNWNANFSQVIQGNFLGRDGENYVLLQIHGGCDVRGGYTSARLFKISGFGETYSLFNEQCGFGVEDANGEFLTLDWYGQEWSDKSGGPPDDDYLEDFALAAGVSPDNRTITLKGDYLAYA